MNENSWHDELCGCKLNMSDLDTAVTKEQSNRFMAVIKKAMKDKHLSPEEFRVIINTIISLTFTQESAIRREHSSL